MQYLEAVRGKEVLTVSDHSDFCSDGGAIALLLATDRLHFAINTHALERSHLTASSRLLQLASAIEDGAPAEGASQ